MVKEPKEPKEPKEAEKLSLITGVFSRISNDAQGLIDFFGDKFHFIEHKIKGEEGPINRPPDSQPGIARSDITPESQENEWQWLEDITNDVSKLSSKEQKTILDLGRSLNTKKAVFHVEKKKQVRQRAGAEQRIEKQATNAGKGLAGAKLDDGKTHTQHVRDSQKPPEAGGITTGKK